MEQALDLMTSDATNESPDKQWLNDYTLRMLLEFTDWKDSEGVLVKELEQRKSVISVADISVLISNLASSDDSSEGMHFDRTPTHETVAEHSQYVNQFLATFRYFITPQFLLTKMIVRCIYNLNCKAY